MSHDRQKELHEDLAYYRRRAAEEAERAERAIMPAVKRAHRDLAAIFERKAGEETLSALDLTFAATQN